MINIIGLTKKYGEQLAVNNLNLNIQPGELFGFLGPNGAGKTTTIKMITGILKPTSGEVIVDNLDMQKQPQEAKKRVGYVPDDPYLYDRLTAREHLGFIGGLYNLSNEEILARSAELFNIFNMNGWVDKRCEEFSHGMRQKLVFCSAFLHQPKVLVVDEPMVGLDPQSSRLVKDLMKQYALKGNTVFVSTHVLSVAEELCDRIGIINNSELIAIGTIAELKAEAAKGDVNLETLFLELTETKS
ncbi:MAG: ABC transporter ATP-binding protein [candidate division Zixibacteria bacterium]|nr:ABC transporter ATP-binding protein [candidate division Zixibacteria bacterium]